MDLFKYAGIINTYLQTYNIFMYKLTYFELGKWLFLTETVYLNLKIKKCCFSSQLYIAIKNILKLICSIKHIKIKEN